VLRYYFVFLLVVGIGASMLSSGGDDTTLGMRETDRAQPLIVAEAASAAEMQYAQRGEVVLTRQSDGHFYADTQINGSTVRMLVDTGASGIALTRDDARKAGIGISVGMPTVVGEGAGGAVRGEYVTLDRISLGAESATSVPAVVLDGGGQSLLGQSFLQLFASVEIKGETMVLR
jgi:aspartyl protease family protein